MFFFFVKQHLQSKLLFFEYFEFNSENALRITEKRITILIKCVRLKKNWFLHDWRLIFQTASRCSIFMLNNDSFNFLTIKRSVRAFYMRPFHLTRAIRQFNLSEIKKTLVYFFKSKYLLKQTKKSIFPTKERGGKILY